jgi:hypothetical protein
MPYRDPCGCGLLGQPARSLVVAHEDTDAPASFMEADGRA